MAAMRLEQNDKCSDNIATRFLVRASLYIGRGCSPEERARVSKFAVPISHTLVNALPKAQLLLLLVNRAVPPHQNGGADNATDCLLSISLM